MKFFDEKIKILSRLSVEYIKDAGYVLFDATKNPAIKVKLDFSLFNEECS